MVNEKISISISQFNFADKAETEKKASKIILTPTLLDLNEITEYVSNGYVISNIFQPDFELRAITTYEKTSENFACSQFVTIDLDGIEEYDTLSSLLASINLIPSIAYTTLSHKQTIDGKYKGNRYRLIYVFNKKITSIGQFKLLYDCIVNYLTTRIENLVCDSHMRNPSQMIYGSTSENRDNKEVYNNNVIYSFTDFSDYKPVIESARTKKEKKYANSFENKDEVIIKISNEKFVKEFGSTQKNETLLSNYSDKYELFEHTPLPVVADNQKFIFLPTNYLEIRREDERLYNNVTKKWFKTGNKRKYRNGEGRRTKLFINALVRCYMIPGITLDHLLYCLLDELSKYYINIPGLDFITREDIKKIAVNALHVDLCGENVVNWFAKNNKNKRKYIINKGYAVANNTTVQCINNQVKKEKNDNIVAKYFDVNLSIKENLKILKENGYTYGKDKLYIYRNELRGKKTKPRTKKVKEVVLEVEDIEFGSSSSSEICELVKQHTTIAEHVFFETDVDVEENDIYNNCFIEDDYESNKYIFEYLNSAM